MREDLLYPIALTMLSGVGAITAKSLLARYGSAEEILKRDKLSIQGNQRLSQILSDSVQKNAALERAKRELDFIERNGLKALFLQNKDYPYRLRECEDSPIVLYQRGETNLNSVRMVAVVGTRNITPYGKEMVEQILRELSMAVPNIVIVSGLAYGVDGNAHKASLSNGMQTVGVVAHGLDDLYPKRHTDLARKMIDQGGAVVTEYHSKTFADPSQFVQRNRIIAGLSDSTIVIESAEKGGALLTAYAANAYNRDVFALPGRASDTFSQGCNNLIKRNQAQIITCGKDLLEAMCWTPSSRQMPEPELFVELTPDEQKVVEILRRKELGVGELSREVGMAVQKLVSMLVMLEFKGVVKQLPGNIYKA